VPEGHTIYRVARAHNRTLRGQRVHADSPQGRFAAGAALLDGRELRRAEAVGKHLFHRYSATAASAEGSASVGGQLWLHVHLGLYGEWRTGETPMPAARGALRLRLWTDQTWWELRGATSCEVLTTPEVQAVRARLGPDPLRRNVDSALAYDRIARSPTAIGVLLMNQAVLAGVGNVYRAELLFRHGIDPHRPGVTIEPARWTAMWADLVDLMRDGVRRGRIVTTRPADRRRSQVYVYRRTAEPCLVCGTPIRTEIMAARNLYWCPRCQPPLTTAAGGPGNEAG